MLLLQNRLKKQLCFHILQLCTSSAADNLGVDAIFVYTKHGQMASLLSRNRPNSPIFAFTDNHSTRMSMNLQWGVTPLLVELSEDMEANITKTIDLIKMKGVLEEGDTVLVVSDITPSCATPKAFQSIQVKTIVQDDTSLLLCFSTIHISNGKAIEEDESQEEDCSVEIHMLRSMVGRPITCTEIFFLNLMVSWVQFQEVCVLCFSTEIRGLGFPHS